MRSDRGACETAALLLQSSGSRLLKTSDDLIELLVGRCRLQRRRSRVTLGLDHVAFLASTRKLLKMYFRLFVSGSAQRLVRCQLFLRRGEEEGSECSVVTQLKVQPEEPQVFVCFFYPQ